MFVVHRSFLGFVASMKKRSGFATVPSGRVSRLKLTKFGIVLSVGFFNVGLQKPAPSKNREREKRSYIQWWTSPPNRNRPMSSARTPLDPMNQLRMDLRALPID